MFAMESSRVRESVYLGLGHLVEADRVKDGFVREVLVQEGEKTPEVGMQTEPKTPVKKVKAVPDPASTETDVLDFMSFDNKDCKVVRVKGTSILAVYGDGRRNCRHKLFQNARGGELRMQCPACNKVFVLDVSLISPVTVVGPRTHNKYGRMIWVCREHWQLSAASEENEEKACEMAALDQESSVIDQVSPIIPSERARRRLNFAGAGPAAAVEPIAGKEVATGRDVASPVAPAADDELSVDVSGDLEYEEDVPAPRRVVRHNAIGRIKAVEKKAALVKKATGTLLSDTE